MQEKLVVGWNFVTIATAQLRWGCNIDIKHQISRETAVPDIVLRWFTYITAKLTLKADTGLNFTTMVDTVNVTRVSVTESTYIYYNNTK